jgi:signal transduction histidine kinase
VFLAIGIALIAPFGTLASLPAEALEEQWGELAAWGSAAVAGFLVLPAATGLLASVRELEIVAVRRLLGVSLPDVQDTDAAPSWPARWRSAAWFVAHVVAGGLMAGVILGLPPFVASAGGAAVVPLAIVSAVGLIYLAAGLSSALARLAPRLLGPSATERLAAMQRHAERLAERNRLARELHDSVGHALAIVTVQAGAASRVLDADREFARRALAEMESCARDGLRDLDHVLGLLRDDEGLRSPAPSLAHLERLVDSTRSAGIEVTAQLSGSLEDVPQAVSCEAYRIVQEGLTNAARHAGGASVTLRLAVGDEDLSLELSNPVGEARPAASGGGRGLNGIRERVTSLRGHVLAGRDGDRWRIAVRLPLHPAP